MTSGALDGIAASRDPTMTSVRRRSDAAAPKKYPTPEPVIAVKVATALPEDRSMRHAAVERRNPRLEDAGSLGSPDRM
jgi:hypothetical protein